MISVVIRCKNEVESLMKLVSFYENQPYKEYELVIVDNNSADNTESFCKEKRIKIIEINTKDFSHASSCNLGLKNANYDLVYFTNAHSFPIHKNILQKISDVMESDLKVAGLFGRCYVYQDSGKVNFIEKVYGGLDELYWSRNYKVVKASHPGLLQSMSSVIRKSYLQNLEFEEMLTGGGEDNLLGRKLIHNNYKIAYLPEMDVYHSHGGSNLKSIKRYYEYALMAVEAWFKSI